MELVNRLDTISLYLNNICGDSDKLSEMLETLEEVKLKVDNKGYDIIVVDPSKPVVYSKRVKELSLETMYKEIDCTTIDITTHSFSDTIADIVVDDEGLLKENFATQFQGGRVLAGKLLICSSDTNGKSIGCNVDIQTVIDNIDGFGKVKY